MARVNWNSTNLASLARLGKAGKFEEAAKLFKCTENAVKIKYGRLTTSPKIVTKIYAHKPMTTTKVIPTLVVNPFKIEQVAYTGLRATPEIIVMLAKQMMNLKANKVDSIAIPLSISKNKRESSNLFQQAKTYISKTIIGENIFTIKTTFSSDAKKTYLGARIWRIK
jgi:hypothetical protein